MPTVTLNTFYCNVDGTKRSCLCTSQLLFDCSTYISCYPPIAPVSFEKYQLAVSVDFSLYQFFKDMYLAVSLL